MKFLPAALTLSCALLLTGCNRPTAGSSDEKQDQERLITEKQALELSALHEREAALDEKERVLNEREQQLNVAAPPQEAATPATPVAAPAMAVAQPPPAAPSADASYQAFYDDLAPFGSWVQIPGYGYAWQPLSTVQDSRWRPYTLGHWVFTDDGWTWVSDEPFGWITYHYGRWMRTHTLGWVWVPGDQWAPAWVSWRYGNDFIGWAPLPPQAGFDGSTPIQQWADDQYNLGPDDYTFVPAAEFGDDTMADVEVPPDQNGPIFDDSNNETDIYYDSAAYAIVCYGPNYDFMRSKARLPLSPPLKISRGGYRAGGRNGTTIAGNTLQVTAPRIVKPRTPPAPKIVRATVADARLVTPAGPPPAPGVIAQPLYQPPRTPASQQAAPPRFAATEPGAAVPAPQLPPRGAGMNNEPPPAERAPAAPRPPGQVNSPSSGADAQNARDLAIIQQQQAERERQVEADQAVEQARAAEEIRARQAAAAERTAAEEQAARADRAQEAARQESAQAAHAAPPATIPAGSQPVVPGQTRTQQ
jgi:hypothetical protein